MDNFDQGEKSAEDWASMDACTLVEHLEATHHAYVRAALPAIARLFSEVDGAEGEFDQLRSAFAELCVELEPHLLKEEQILFPMIRELYASTVMPAFHCGSLRNPISMMCFEHDRADQLLDAIRDRTSAFTAPQGGSEPCRLLYEALAELDADTRLHIRKENEVLFPTVIREELRREGLEHRS